MSLIITIEELESLLKEKDSETANALRNFIYNYKKERADEEEKEQLTLEHFKSLGIPESALYSEVRDDINCQRLEFGLHTFSHSRTPEWYLDCNAGLWIPSWDCETLLDVLAGIEEETNQQIVKFGLMNTHYYASKENQGKVLFGKIKGEVCLAECEDSFNLKLSDGRYFHLYFCESK